MSPRRSLRILLFNVAVLGACAALTASASAIDWTPGATAVGAVSTDVVLNGGGHFTECGRSDFSGLTGVRSPRMSVRMRFVGCTISGLPSFPVTFVCIGDVTLQVVRYISSSQGEGTVTFDRNFQCSLTFPPLPHRCSFTMRGPQTGGLTFRYASGVFTFVTVPLAGFQDPPVQRVCGDAAEAFSLSGTFRLAMPASLTLSP